MKIIKRIISLVLMLSIIAASTVFASSDAGSVQMDIGKNAYDFLKAVGALDVNELAYDADMKITRAHFVKLALHLSNDAPNVLVSNDEVFADVNADTQYEAYIEKAYRLGHISGAPGLNFNPDETITLSQAVKIIVSILGYGQMAELRGGYPNGYFYIAQELKLLTGLGVNASVGLSMNDAMVLMHNASKANILRQVSYGDNMDFEAKDGINLLSERHEIKSVEGIVNANPYTEIYAQDSGLEKGRIKLDDVVYTAAYEKVLDYIGKRVTLYYIDDGASYAKNAVYAEISEDNIIVNAKAGSLEADGRNIRVYDENDNYKSYSLSVGVSYIVNNKMMSMTPAELCDINCGDITLISNNDDKVIDVIIVSKYDNMVAEGVDPTSGVIITKDGSIFEVDSDSSDYTVILEKDGYPATINDIKCDDSLLVSASSGRGFGFIKILASSKKLSGTFSEIGDDYVVANGNTYSLCGLSSSELVLGTNYTVYLNAFGEICCVKNNKDVVYGFLYGIAKATMQKPKCKIFTENNRWVELDFADKVKYTDHVAYNGSKLSGDDLYLVLSNLGDSYKQMVRYSVNENAQLISLELASSDYTLGALDTDYAHDNNVFRKSYDGTIKYYSANTFGCKFFVDDHTKVFVIPSSLEESKFKVRSISVFTNDEEYAVTAYDIDDMLGCPVLVIADASEESTISNKFMVVSGKGMKLNTDGDAVPSILGYRNGIEISVPVDISDDTVTQARYDSVNIGDIIVSKFDDNGNIFYIARYDTTKDYYTSYTNLYYRYLVLCGKVVKNDANLSRLRVVYNEAGDETGLLYTSSTEVHIYDRSEQTVKKATTASILPGDKIYARMRYLNCNEIIIIRD